MNNFGRIALCGAMGAYGGDKKKGITTY